MEIVEIGSGTEAYKKGYRAGICCKRYENMPIVADLYDFWLTQTYAEHRFDVHFTMDAESNCVLCFKTMEELFLAKLTFGFSVTEN